MKLFNKENRNRIRRKMLQVGTALIGLMAIALIIGNAGFSFSGYFTSANGSARARVAKYEVTVSSPVLLSEDNILDCNNENDSIDYFVEISNHSETEVEYRIEVILSNPELFELGYENETGRLEPLNGSEGIVISLKIKNPEDISRDMTLDDIKVRVTAAQSAGGG